LLGIEVGILQNKAALQGYREMRQRKRMGTAKQCIQCNAGREKSFRQTGNN
jgi:hypothetical protein